MLVQHSSVTCEYNTPNYIAEVVKDFLGVIDLDPASNEVANKTIGATEYFREADDGLSLSWRANSGEASSVFCNPPGGKIKNRSVAKMFWSKCLSQRIQGNIWEAVFLFFNPNILQTSQQDCILPVTAFPICFLDRRVKYLDQLGNPVKNPPGISLLVYVPGIADRRDEFFVKFRPLGDIK